MFLIQESLNLIFSQQYSRVLLNEDEKLKCLKSETKEKMNNNYLYRRHYIDYFFLLFAGYDRATKVRNLLA